MFPRIRFLWLALVVFVSDPVWTDCQCRAADPQLKESGSPGKGADQVRAEIDDFRNRIRAYYDSSNFDALEKSVAEVRATDGPLFQDGSWKIYHFYTALRCRTGEPESVWPLHNRIHKEWETAKPDSITARIAHADFLAEYAWYVRGSDEADKVSKERLKIAGAQFTAAREILEQARPMQPQCPMWWLVSMRVGLGQGWNRPEYEALYHEAKKLFPRYVYYDVALATYLLPRWYGKRGDWEAAAREELIGVLRRNDDLGISRYAYTVGQMRGYYTNIFEESKASWQDTQAGYQQMWLKHPNSLENTTVYFQLACYAGDRPLAQRLLRLLNGYVDERIWTRPSDYNKMREWALAGK